MLRWWLHSMGWISGDGQFRIARRVDEPGFKGYKLYHGGEHVSTHRLLRDAKSEAERLKAEWIASTL